MRMLRAPLEGIQAFSIHHDITTIGILQENVVFVNGNSSRSSGIAAPASLIVVQSKTTTQPHRLDPQDAQLHRHPNNAALMTSAPCVAIAVSTGVL